MCLILQKHRKEIAGGRNMLKHMGEKELEPICGIAKKYFLASVRLAGESLRIVVQKV